MKRPLFFSAATLCAAGLAVSVAGAEVLSIPSSLCGTYNAAGGYGNSLGHQNYRVGLSPITTTPETRNFFNFDLTGYASLPPGSIASAAVKLYMPKFAPPDLLDPGDGYISPDATELYRLTATPYSAADLAAAHTPVEAADIWATLGTGPLAGEILTHPGDKGMTLTIPLTPGAIGAIEGIMGSGFVSMGGRIVSYDGTHIDELLFGFTDIPSPHMFGKEPELEITLVPEPSAAVMVAVCGLLAARRRRS